MIIQDITTCGFQRIHQGFWEAHVNGYPEYSAKLMEYLSHAMVTINISDITSIEVAYLRKFSSEIHVTNKSYSNFIKPDNDPNSVYHTIEGITQLHNSIIKDSDINNSECEADNILPIGCVHYDVMVIFKGFAITAITGVMMSDVFRDDSHHIMKDYPGNTYIENKLVELFPGAFYKFMRSKMTTVDVTTEYMTNKKYYQYADSIVGLANINTYNGELVFFGATNQSLTAQQQSLNERRNSHPYVFEDAVIMDFVFSTSFNTFMYFLLNTSMVVDFEPLMVVSNKEEIAISDDINVKYGNRIIEIINRLNDYKNSSIKSNNESNKFDFNTMNFIMSGVNIKYCVQIPYSKLADFYHICELSTIDEISIVRNTIEKCIPLVDKMVM